ncbi:hypothetical protein DXM27_05190 [Rhizobium rhizogenes]|uniref:Uncharacterized protein n=1 Tax=Rhizobium rhizogenes TaxID=359 RepID=A0AA88JU73_RHIRH|nr:hypothetical protein [Rhizobium rhizogenes]KAA3504609.1 hypothetical protein DXM27_05190 [Rhizobium rhizogenes]
MTTTEQERERGMRFFMVNGQQYFSVDQVSEFDDYGFAACVTLKSGRQYNINGDDKDKLASMIRGSLINP